MSKIQNPTTEEIISFVKQLFNKKGGFKITNPYVYVQAFTHTSYAHEHSNTKDNEVLEFIGDEFLDESITRILLSRYSLEMKGSIPWFITRFSESELTEMKTELVRGDNLAKAAKSWGFGKLLRVGESAESQGIRNNSKMLENAFEALIAAVAIDSSYYDTEKGDTKKDPGDHIWLPDLNRIDYQEVDRVVTKLLRLNDWFPKIDSRLKGKEPERGPADMYENPKGALNEYYTLGIIDRPEYAVVDSKMDAQNRQLWKCSCRVPGYNKATSDDYFTTKKAAEGNAALKVLKAVIKAIK